MNELAELAKLDGIVGGKKQEATMASAMSSNERIREWVSSAPNNQKNRLSMSSGRRLLQIN